MSYFLKFSSKICIWSLVFLLFKPADIFPQQLKFQEQSLAAGIDHLYQGLGYMGSGAVFFDANGDNFEDLFLTGGFAPDRLFINKGDGTFRDANAGSGIGKNRSANTIGVVAGDLDNDGFRDLIISTRNEGCLIFQNLGNETFRDITQSSGIRILADGSQENKQGFSISLGDVNLDGYLDIYVVNWVDSLGYLYDSSGKLSGFEHSGGRNRLFLNQQDLSFREVAQSYGVDDAGSGLASVFSDFDQDGDLDLLIANDFGEWLIPNALYRNLYPEPSFENISQSSAFDIPMYGMGLAVGDYDQDMDLDYYITNIGRNSLLQNRGNERFEEVSETAEVTDTYIYDIAPYLSIGWGAGFVDLDLDTDLDLLVANGRIGSTEFFPSLDSMPDKVYLNEGNGKFKDFSIESDFIQYGLSRGLSYGDYDNDGDIDVLLSCVPHIYLGLQGKAVLFKNEQTSDNHWLKVKLEGVLNNRDALGAQLLIYSGEKSWIHEINSGGQGHNSMHSTVAHIGLGERNSLDSLIVRWPGRLSPDQHFYNIPADQFLLIREGENKLQEIEAHINSGNGELFQLHKLPNPVEKELVLSYSLGSPMHIRISLLDLLGKEVLVLLDEIQEANRFTMVKRLNPQWTEGLYLMRIEYEEPEQGKVFETKKLWLRP
ncbi:MAG: FG-GAP-like repeat-containing protein [Bacteroidia bacterium]|nr:FG-GAP-like repeat-containing protein [Bacteroidia bacterium]